MVVWKKHGSWSTRATSRLRSARRMVLMSRPSIRTRPESGSSRRTMRSAMVDLPLPLAPTSATVSPGLTEKLASTSTGSRSNEKLTRSKRTSPPARARGPAVGDSTTSGGSPSLGEVGQRQRQRGAGQTCAGHQQQSCPMRCQVTQGPSQCLAFHGGDQRRARAGGRPSIRRGRHPRWPRRPARWRWGRSSRSSSCSVPSILHEGTGSHLVERVTLHVGRRRARDPPLVLIDQTCPFMIATWTFR